ncbi:unnamed protein product [Gadus morhua 'NCC']
MTRCDSDRAFGNYRNPPGRLWMTAGVPPQITAAPLDTRHSSIWRCCYSCLKRGQNQMQTKTGGCSSGHQQMSVTQQSRAADFIQACYSLTPQGFRSVDAVLTVVSS